MREVILGDGQHEQKVMAEMREVNYGNKDYRWFVGDTEFDGHYTLWGFEYFPTTYLKSSSLSGNEWRKGGEICYYRNRQLCFTEFCREPERAVFKIAATLPKLMSFEWEHLEIGRKVFYERTPAVIDSLIPQQGCVILRTEDGKKFPDAVWKDDDDVMGEREEYIKVGILDPNIWWWRK